jgi:hypothetical protein
VPPHCLPRPALRSPTQELWLLLLLTLNCGRDSGHALVMPCGAPAPAKLRGTVLTTSWTCLLVVSSAPAKLCNAVIRELGVAPHSPFLGHGPEVLPDCCTAARPHLLHHQPCLGSNLRTAPDVLRLLQQQQQQACSVPCPGAGVSYQGDDCNVERGKLHVLSIRRRR